MKDSHTDIGDNEIRIISSEDKKSPDRRKKWHHIAVMIGILLILISVVSVIVYYSLNEEIETESVVNIPDVPVHTPELLAETSQPTHYTSLRDTVIDGVGLRLLTPVNSHPTLETGVDVLSDSTVILAAQAADIRRDNGKIVGACIVGGELVSKGEAKAGFCAIVNDEITLGVADATPMFEQALMSDGYFFRQYPLVAGGQIIENKPKGKAIRKALAEADGSFCVIISREALTFHDFSQALIDLGVRNAIYLVGSTSAGIFKDEQGQRSAIGKIPDEALNNVNFIVWR